jgi:hypothetical protein
VTVPATEPLAATQRQFLWSIDGCPGYWQQKTGGDVEAPVTVVWNGGADRPQKLGGPPDATDIVLTQAYRPQMHREARDTFKRGAGFLRVGVHGIELDANGQAIGDPITYPLALLVKVTEPPADFASGAQSDWSVTVALGDEA